MSASINLQITVCTLVNVNTEINGLRGNYFPWVWLISTQARNSGHRSKRADSLHVRSTARTHSWSRLYKRRRRATSFYSRYMRLTRIGRRPPHTSGRFSLSPWVPVVSRLNVHAEWSVGRQTKANRRKVIILRLVCFSFVVGARCRGSYARRNSAHALLRCAAVVATGFS